MKATAYLEQKQTYQNKIKYKFLIQQTSNKKYTNNNNNNNKKQNSNNIYDDIWSKFNFAPFNFQKLFSNL